MRYQITGGLCCCCGGQGSSCTKVVAFSPGEQRLTVQKTANQRLTYFACKEGSVEAGALRLQRLRSK